MPLYARYLLSRYFRIVCLTLISFILILLVTRLQEVAHFAALGASPKLLTLFTLYQIPYILPLCLPLASLLGAFLLFQNLSKDHELMALRACGLSLVRLLAPLLAAGLLLSLLNLTLTSEIATQAHLTTREMVYKLTSTNPLILLQNSKISSLKNSYLQLEEPKGGEGARNLLIALPSHNETGMHLLIAKNLRVAEGKLRGDQVTLISSGTKEEGDLLIENGKQMEMEVADFSQLMRKSGWRLSTDHLNLSYLRVRAQGWRELLRADPTQRAAKEGLSKCYAEMARRIFLGIMPLALTFLGMACSMDHSRRRSKRGLLSLLAVVPLVFVSFFTAKAVEQSLLLSLALLIVPLALIGVTALLLLKQVREGRFS